MPNLAPANFVQWMTQNTQVDRKLGHEYRYHPRSDSHSIAICKLVVEDLVNACPLLAEHARLGKVVYGVNVEYMWPRSSKTKTIDLALGFPVDTVVDLLPGFPIAEAAMRQVIFSCEAKACMTEHSKSQPRIFDELSSSHAIVHAGDNNAIAAGITVVNIANRFVSPLRQKIPGAALEWTNHTQPRAATNMVNHLRGLPIRSSLDEPGFDAFATIVIDCDNQQPAGLINAPPAPQPGERDHYDTFVESIARAYTERFSSL
ncbi:MAG: hypothetical protein QM775_31105 [Pirellulales bacterium]